MSETVGQADGHVRMYVHTYVHTHVHETRSVRDDAKGSCRLP